MTVIYAILTLTLILSAPIIIAGLGGLITERSGVTNIALEGLMMLGGFTAATTVVFLEQNIPTLAPWISIILGAIIGMLFSAIHAFISIQLKGDQIVSGAGINFLATGVTIYFCQIIFNQQRTENFTRGFVKSTFPILSDIPIIGPIFFSNIYSSVYVALILVALVWFIINKTVIGLRLKAAGEHPGALESAGVSVYTIRFFSVLSSGFLAGLAGGVMVLTQDTQYTVLSIHGTGFIALATMIFGKWRALGVLGAGLLFGFLQVTAIYSTSVPALSFIPKEIFKTLPYILTIVALVLFSKNNNAPKALAIPYDKEKR